MEKDVGGSGPSLMLRRPEQIDDLGRIVSGLLMLSVTEAAIWLKDLGLNSLETALVLSRAYPVYQIDLKTSLIQAGFEIDNWTEIRDYLSLITPFAEEEF